MLNHTECENLYFCISKEDSLIIKGVAVIMMVIHHVWGFPDKVSFITPPHLVGLASLCKLCVSIFIFMSGYALTTKYSPSHVFSVRELFKRIYKLFRLYWKIFILFIPFGFLMGYREVHLQELVQNFFCLSSTYNREWWFMSMYIELSLVYYFLSKIHPPIAFFTMLSILTLIAYPLAHYLSTLERNLVTDHLLADCYYWGTFAIGMVLGKYRLPMPSSKYFLWILILLMGCAAFVRKRFELDCMNVLITPIFVYVTIKLLCSKRCNSILKFMGKHSMNIWLIHTFICYYYFNDLLGVISFKNPWLALVIVFASSILFSMITNIFFNHLSKSVHINHDV